MKRLQFGFNSYGKDSFHPPFEIRVLNKLLRVKLSFFPLVYSNI